MKLFLMFLLSCFIVTQAQAGPLATTCLGVDEKEAKGFMIYLHGMDSKEPSFQEQWSRYYLLQVAMQLKLRIAVPRADMECPSDLQFEPHLRRICWGWGFETSRLEAIVPKIIESRTNCFSEEKIFGVFGFSNGGYLINHWFTSPLYSEITPAPQWVATVGSSIGQIPSGLKAGSLKSRSMTIIVGQFDEFNVDHERKFYQQLLSKGADVTEVPFPGGHEVLYDPVYQALEKHYPRNEIKNLGDATLRQ